MYKDIKDPEIKLPSRPIIISENEKDNGTNVYGMPPRAPKPLEDLDWIIDKSTFSIHGGTPKEIVEKFNRIREMIKVKSSKEICDMLNEYVNSMGSAGKTTWQYENNSFDWIDCNSDKKIQISSIAYENENPKRVSFILSVPIELAHEITKFFMYSEELKR